MPVGLQKGLIVPSAESPAELVGLAASGLYSSGATFREGPWAVKSNRDIPPSPPWR
ncbi:MAG: hypothetical protein HY671_04920 [Chloroflexi bacterium]|nr:hypothetical protein [Chloroflexota bacterium]